MIWRLAKNWIKYMEYVLGLKFEKINNSVAIIVVNKSELQYFPDKIFYSEFLDLTTKRWDKQDIHLKQVNIP